MLLSPRISPKNKIPCKYRIYKGFVFTLRNGRVMNIVHNCLYITYLYFQKINYFTNHAMDK
jgi:hypothetical protein